MINVWNYRRLVWWKKSVLHKTKELCKMVKTVIILKIDDLAEKMKTDQSLAVITCQISLIQGPANNGKNSNYKKSSARVQGPELLLNSRPRTRSWLYKCIITRIWHWRTICCFSHSFKIRFICCCKFTPLKNKSGWWGLFAQFGLFSMSVCLPFDFWKPLQTSRVFQAVSEWAHCW